MNEMLNMETIYRQVRQRWMNEKASRRSFRNILNGTVSHWIVLVALVSYGLSAPHTAGVFDKLTPSWRWLAPVGVEFGLLYGRSADASRNPTRKPCPGHYGLWKSFFFDEQTCESVHHLLMTNSP